MTAQREFVVGEVKRLMRFPLLFVFGILRPSGKEVAIGPSQIIKGPFDHTFRDIIGPRISSLPDRMELLLEREGTGRFEDTLLFRICFLLGFVCLILLLPLLSSPIVHKASCATGPLQILHLFRSWVHADLVR